MSELPVDTHQIPQVELPESLALLPVKDLVLFPFMIVPLLVAREVSAAAVDQALGATKDRLIFVTVQRAEDESPQPETLNTVGTVATIVRMRKLSDGRMKILLQGLFRARVVAWLGTEPCFTVTVEQLPDLGGHAGHGEGRDNRSGAAVDREGRSGAAVDREGRSGPAVIDPRGPMATAELDALRRQLKDDLERYARAGKASSPELISAIAGVDDPGRLSDLCSANLQMKPEEAQPVLEERDPERRLRLVSTYLRREVEVLQMQELIQSRAKEVMSKNQREHYLREQLRQIHTELGFEGGGEVAELRRRVAEAGLSGEALAEAERELRRLETMQPATAEYQVIRSHLDWLVELPWARSTRDQLDLLQARRILDEDHYDLAHIKDRILEFMSVLRLRQAHGHDRGATLGEGRGGVDGRGEPGPLGVVLCFAGPPGVGKTSLGRSIARALGRRFVRVSLGGVRDEAELRGHRRTYVGAMPGRLIQGLRQAGTRNPVILLDEIDKLVRDAGADPAAALLEVLDPEQNHSFRDHYLGVPFDLSQALFIATANAPDRIPQALRDRLELLELSGYSDEEKLSIARAHIVPRAVAASGVAGLCDLRFTGPALLSLIRDYTREAGLRDLERQLAAVCRKVARQLVEAEDQRRPPPLTTLLPPVLPRTPRRSMTIAPSALLRFLGPPRYQRRTLSSILPSAPAVGAPGEDGVSEVGPPPGEALPALPIGAALGLAWTPVGGEVLEIESQWLPGRGTLTLTGQLGDVMKESAQAALSYARAKACALGLPDHLFGEREIHIHVPAGAVPKDGPSAGLTMACALVSLLTNVPVRGDLAMTGEITLRGRVLPVGGIKEKLLAALRAGVSRVLCPEGNRRDIEDIPKAALRGLTLILVASMDDVLKEALVAPARPSQRASRHGAGRIQKA